MQSFATGGPELAPKLTACRLRELPTGEPSIVEVSGEIDIACAPAIEARLLSLPVGDTVVDLGGVRFFSAAGLTVLLRLRYRLLVNGYALWLARPSPMVRWMITVVELTDELPYRPSIEQAVDALTGQRR